MTFNKVSPIVMIVIVIVMTLLMKIDSSPFYMILLVDLVIFAVMFGFYMMIRLEDRPNNKHKKMEETE